MTLGADAFDRLRRLLLDAYSDVEDLREVARCMEWRLQEIASADPSLREAVRALIEEAEISATGVAKLVDCCRKQSPEHEGLRDLDVATLAAAKTAEEVVDDSGGASSFKDRLKAALAQLAEPHLEQLAAGEVTDLLEGAADAEAETVYLALLGYLKAKQSDEVVVALTPVFVAALKRHVGPAPRPEAVVVDLARVHLRRPELGDLDLHQADIAFADLRHADLDGAVLFRSKGYEVDVSEAGISRSNLEEIRWQRCVARETRFHDARMISAFLKESDLTGAEFQRARLQGAHLERTVLNGSKFEQAELADAYFTGATIDEAAVRSISRAIGWEKAHFDAPVRAQIEAAANGGG